MYLFNFNQQSLVIDKLTKHKHLARELAKWAFDEWHSRNSTRFSQVLRDYEIRARSETMPVCWIALKGKTPVGMVSLKKRDLQFRTDLSPWLSALYVLKEYRRTGIGQSLIKTVIDEAFRQHYRSLYLFTDRSNTEYLTRYYTSRNWRFFDKSTDMQGNDINILVYNLK